MELYVCAIQGNASFRGHMAEEVEIVPFLNKQFATVYLEYLDTENGVLRTSIRIWTPCSFNARINCSGSGNAV